MCMTLDLDPPSPSHIPPLTPPPSSPMLLTFLPVPSTCLLPPSPPPSPPSSPSNPTSHALSRPDDDEVADIVFYFITFNREISVWPVPYLEMLNRSGGCCVRVNTQVDL